MTDDEILAAARHTLAAARAKHPRWPADPIHAAAIVAEESGELTQAALQFTYEGRAAERMRAEAFHVLATTIRFLAETPIA